MKIRRKTQLHVVRDDEEMMINRLLTELDDEDNVTAEEEIKDKKSKRKKILIRTAIAGGAVLLLSVVMYFWTYTSANIVTSHQTVMESNNSYQQFAKGVLKYSRDGIAYLNRKNEEIWNHPYQIKNPMIERYKETAAVADKGGNYIAVFDEKGVKRTLTSSERSEFQKISGAIIEENVENLLSYAKPLKNAVCNIFSYGGAGDLAYSLHSDFNVR